MRIVRIDEDDFHLDYKMIVIKCFPHHILRNSGGEFYNPRYSGVVNDSLIHTFFLSSSLYNMAKQSYGFHIALWGSDYGDDDISFALSATSVPTDLDLHFPTELPEVLDHHSIRLPLKVVKCLL